MKELDFTGQNVFVVGGSSGIGNGIAHKFRKQGAKVFITGTRESAADYDDEEGSDLTGLHYSQLDAADVEAVKKFKSPFKTLDVLVLSQGTVMYKRAEFDIENFKKVVDVNLNSVMDCCTKFFGLLEASDNGSIIVINSTAAFHSTKGNPAYNASKTGAFGLTRTLGEAWARKGIRVNGIAPGLVETKLTRITTQHPDRLAKNMQRIPIGRLGTPEDMGNVALFLASPLSAYIVGETLKVDGGRLLD